MPKTHQKMYAGFIGQQAQSNDFSRGLKIYSKASNWSIVLGLLVWFLSAHGGCVRIVPSPLPERGEAPAPQRGEAPPQEASSPRVLASLRLTAQGRVLLEHGRLDDAISLFERAVSLNPMNGENYYYLADAWLAKGDQEQAKEFNRLASLYLKEETWALKLTDQQERIKRGHR